MSNTQDLTAELRAAREARVRAERSYPQMGGPVLPPSTRFPWLQMLSVDELASHIERLERDIADAVAGEFSTTTSKTQHQSRATAQAALTDYNNTHTSQSHD
ncbi:hypothetical protein [Halogeometricum pallidum]|uniref:hypothetical protein n=1 Tax=Halogeometricum pallidum TaxID=411361 RepID=UPI0012681E8D|nr:hypothetical protein [Halogeometricum pallidum]